MQEMSNLERQKLKVSLAQKMNAFIEELPEGNNIGYIPQNLEDLMANAAFAVLLSVHETQRFLWQESLMNG